MKKLYFTVLITALLLLTMSDTGDSLFKHGKRAIKEIDRSRAERTGTVRELNDAFKSAGKTRDLIDLIDLLEDEDLM
ncbi:hypothetical protein ACROYT_G023029 [Oculina patagonica]